MEQQSYKIQQLTSFSPEIGDSLRLLSQQVGDNYQELTDADIKEMLASPNHFLFIATSSDGTIAGMILALVYRIPYVRKAYLDDLIVDTHYQGQGIGSALLEHAVSFTKEHGAAYVDFTSRPERVSGNSLYTKLGFKKRDTNIYRKIFHYGKKTDS